MTQSNQTPISPNNYKAMGVSRSKIKWWAIYIYANIYANSQSRGSQLCIYGNHIYYCNYGNYGKSL